MHKLKQHIVSIVLLMCLLFTQATTVFASSNGSESENIGTSMYDVSTALSAYANSVVGANTNDKHNSHKLSELNWNNKLKPGIAGAFVGYGDANKDFYAYIASNTAQSVTTSSYDAWLNVGDKGSTYSYVRYGHLLDDLGLDDTAPNSESSGGRSTFGMLMYGVHAISGFVPKVFEFSTGILKTLNPFQFFIGNTYSLDERTTAFTDANTSSKINGVDNGSFDSGNTKTNVSNDNTAKNAYGSKVNTPAILSSLRNYVTELYGILQSIGLFAIIPLMIAMLLASVLLKARSGHTQTGGWSKLRVIVTRLAFIVIGIPVCGLLYTSVLNQINNVVATRPASSRMVACTFVDFQTWVQTSRLDLPNNVTLVSVGVNSADGDTTSASGSASADTIRQLRNYTFQINKKSGLIPSSYTSGLGFGASVNSMVNAGMWDTSGNLSTDTKDSNMQKKMAALLTRYRNGGFYQASAWETAVNGAITKNHASELGATPSTSNATSNQGKVYEMYDEMDEVSDWLDRTIADNTSIFKGNDTAHWKKFNIVANGALNVSSSGTNLSKSKLTYKSGGTTWTSDVSDPAKKGGLSSVAMYNYLCTSFGDTSVSVYSANNSTSEYTKQSHYNVNLIGTGVLRTLYGANAVATMGIFAIIGVVYGLGMIFGNLKRGISLIMQIPGAMLGALKSIVQVVVYAFMMIIELLGTVFIYQFICELITMFASVIETPIENAVNSATVIGGNFAVVGSVVTSDIVRNSVGVFQVGFLAITIGLLFVGKNSITRRRAVLTVYEYVMCKFFRRMTFTEFEPIFDAWMASRKSLYAWDYVADVVDSVSDVIANVSDDVVNTVGDVVTNVKLTEKGVNV